MTASSTRTMDRPRLDDRPAPDDLLAATEVEALLRMLPSHGWTAGWTGRRDRALLVLRYQAGLSYTQIAALAAGDVTIKDGTAIIRTHGGRTTLSRDEDSLLCGPCGLARWVHALDLTVVYPDGRVIALVTSSPHLCESNNPITDLTRGLPLLPPINRWGAPGAITPWPAPRSISSSDAANRAHLLLERVDQLLTGG
jgi:hypothetical protein